MALERSNQRGPSRWIWAIGGKPELWSGLGLLLFWEIASRVGFLDARFFPPPTAILGTAFSFLLDPARQADLVATLGRLGTGIAIGAIPGIALGLAMGISVTLRLALDPLISVLNALPKSALFPLLLLIFGLGEGSRLAMVALGVFIPVVVNSMEGVRSIERVFFDVAKVFGASRYQEVRTVALPASIPMVLTGLRLGVGMGIVLGVLAEMLSGKNGLGHILWTSWQVFWVPGLYAALTYAGLIGVLSAYLLEKIRLWVAPWAKGR
ncbi:ABC transporter permease [Thermus thermophilus]|uniref:ABC transporter permease n=1 Tax=Thermus thermophilus TaxID=274 RepID=UPI0011653EEB|nr:ABC transporter permease [Thermus thermophilus]BBL83399.1 ABC transporter permease [Thermus thermophilus]